MRRFVATLRLAMFALLVSSLVLFKLGKKEGGSWGFGMSRHWEDEIESCVEKLK